MQKKEKTEQREYSVYKSNDLIQKTAYDLTVCEQRIILRLIQIIHPDDTEFKQYAFDIQEFCEICGIEKDNGKNYINIKQAIKNLADKSFWLQTTPKSKVLCRWIEKAVIDEETGALFLQLDKDLMPHLLQLKNNFTSYNLYNVLGMRSKYSPRIYELLKSHEYKKCFVLEVSDLMSMVLADSYEYKMFKVRVLNTAIEEINTLTDIHVEYTPIKQGRKVVALKFNVRKNTVDESIDSAVKRTLRLDTHEQKDD